jgi:hypothetical protein
MDAEKILKSKTFAAIFIIWALVINVLYYLQFKDLAVLFLKKLGFMQ